MGDIKGPKSGQRQKAIDELRSHSVGRLIQIIEMLETMDLSPQEIETVLRTCGLNDECAMRFGASITAERENNHNHPDHPMHP